MTSDKYAKLAEVAILLHHKIPHWNKQSLFEFVRKMAIYERDLSSLNFDLSINVGSNTVRDRNRLVNEIREAIFNDPHGKEIGTFSFHENPEDAAIKFAVGKRFANHADRESLTFKF